MRSKRNTEPGRQVRRAGTREKLADLIAAHGWARISEPEWVSIRGAFSSISEATLRKHLVSLGVVVDQPWRGVYTASLDSLEETLRELTVVYESDPRTAREVVIRAKDRTRFIARSPKVSEETRAAKSEMVEWMLVWLGDPRMFPVWVGLRRAVLEKR